MGLYPEPYWSLTFAEFGVLIAGHRWRQARAQQLAYVANGFVSNIPTLDELLAPPLTGDEEESESMGEAEKLDRLCALAEQQNKARGGV